jgi:hypothetical protein
MTTWYELNYPDSTIDDWDQATTSEADTYHAARGNTDWQQRTSTERSQALQRAWDYLRGLDWLDDVFDTELPDDVKNAQIVGALEELKSPGILQPSLTADNFVHSKNIGGAMSKTYRSGAPVKTRFSALESLLRPYLYTGIRVYRG